MNRDTNDLIARLNRDHGGAHRAATVEGVDRETRTVKLAFASEGAEVPRWFGKEVLGHNPSEVRLDRLNDSAALLMDHNTRDQVGVLTPGSAQIGTDRVSRVEARFGTSPRATEIFNDVADGIRKHVSVGYRVHAMQHVETRANDEDVFRITDWEPHEVSFVSVPADHSVGVGRNYPPDTVEQQNNTRENEASTTPEVGNTSPGTVVRATMDENEILTRARLAEQKRVKDILDLGRQYNAGDLAAEHAGNPDGTLEGLQRALLERTGHAAPIRPANSDIGMKPQDLRNFSMVKIARALSDPTNRKAQDAAGFEREVSDEARKNQRSQDSGNWVVPSDVLRSHIYEGYRADADAGDMNLGSNGQTGAGSTGANLVAENLLASSYIDILRNKATFTHGVAMLGGLVGNIDIPKQVAATQGYWVGEGDDATISEMDFGQIRLTPKTVAAYVDVTRKFLQQSSLDVESLIRRDLARSMGLTIDLSGYYGTGNANQPTGLKALTGVAGQAFVGKQPTYAELVNMETTIALANADVDGMRYKARADFRGYAKQTLKFAVNGSSTIWEGGDRVNGYACDISNQINSGDLFMGNFADVLMGMWGGLEMMVDPYANSKSGGVRIVTFQDIDWGFRRTESFVVGSGNAAAPAGG